MKNSEIAYQTSRDYSRLYNLLKAGNKITGYVAIWTNGKVNWEYSRMVLMEYCEEQKFFDLGFVIFEDDIDDFNELCGKENIQFIDLNTEKSQTKENGNIQITEQEMNNSFPKQHEYMSFPDDWDKDKKYSFNEIVNTTWNKSYPYDSHGASADIGGGVIFIMPEIWDEFRPLSHSMDEEDTIKLYSMLYYSKDMFKLLEEMEDEKAKSLINRILSDKNKPEEGFRNESEED